MDGDALLSSVSAVHPRLFATDRQMERVKKLASTDTLLQQYIKDVLSKADKLVNSPVPTSVRPCQDELMCLGFARRYTGSL